MRIIVAADDNWGIGKDGKLLYHIPADMKVFKQKTLYNIVIMGRKTLESLPDGKPLKSRINVIMTRNQDFTKEGCFIVHNVEELQALCERWNTSDIYVIGGSEIYRELLPYCDTVFLTKIHAAEEADAYFPDLDKNEAWKLIHETSEKEYNGIRYRFCKYGRV